MPALQTFDGDHGAFDPGFRCHAEDPDWLFLFRIEVHGVGAGDFGVFIETEHDVHRTKRAASVLQRDRLFGGAKKVLFQTVALEGHTLALFDDFGDDGGHL